MIESALRVVACLLLGAGLYVFSLKLFLLVLNRTAIRTAVRRVGRDRLVALDAEAPEQRDQPEWQSRQEAIQHEMNVEIAKVHRIGTVCWHVYSALFWLAVIVVAMRAT